MKLPDLPRCKVVHIEDDGVISTSWAAFDYDQMRAYAEEARKPLIELLREALPLVEAGSDGDWRGIIERIRSALDSA